MFCQRPPVPATKRSSHQKYLIGFKYFCSHCFCLIRVHVVCESLSLRYRLYFRWSSILCVFIIFLIRSFDLLFTPFFLYKNNFIRTRASNFSKIKNNLRTFEPRIFFKNKNTEPRLLSNKNKHLNLGMFKNKSRTFEPHFWRKIKNNKATEKNSGSYKKMVYGYGIVLRLHYISFLVGVTLFFF